jgi:hypothetical protein
MEKDLADDIQAEIMKVTVIKSRIIRTMAGGVSLHHFPIDKFRRELRELHQAMPSEIAIGRVFDDQRPSPLRANTFYLHLFYLSAMQLLHRRVILHTEESRQSSSAKEAIREGLVAAKMAARVLSLMRLEGTIVQICWLCMSVFQPGFYARANGFRIASHHTLQQSSSYKRPSRRSLLDIAVLPVSVT